MASRSPTLCKLCFYDETSALKDITPIILLRTPRRILFRLGFVSVTNEERRTPRLADKTTVRPLTRPTSDKPTGQQAFRFHVPTCDAAIHYEYNYMLPGTRYLPLTIRYSAWYAIYCCNYCTCGAIEQKSAVSSYKLVENNIITTFSCESRPIHRSLSLNRPFLRPFLPLPTESSLLVPPSLRDKEYKATGRVRLAYQVDLPLSILFLELG